MTPDEPSFYTMLGGEDAVRRLVDRFYDHMDALPEAAPIRAMHARELRVSRDKLFMFLSGWLGGPALYWERYGHPRLRMRHLPFAIDAAARDQWLLCMSRAMDEVVTDPALRRHLDASFAHTADFMRNQPEPGEEPSGSA